MIRVGEGIDVLVTWSTKGMYVTGQRPKRPAGHWGEGMGEEKELIAGDSARRRTHSWALPWDAASV